MYCPSPKSGMWQGVLLTSCMFLFNVTQGHGYLKVWECKTCFNVSDSACRIENLFSYQHWKDQTRKEFSLTFSLVHWLLLSSLAFVKMWAYWCGASMLLTANFKKGYDYQPLHVIKIKMTSIVTMSPFVQYVWSSHHQIAVVLDTTAVIHHEPRQEQYIRPIRNNTFCYL